MPFDPERAAAAREEAARLAARIARADPAVRAVYLFGSLAAGTPRSVRFDIDLAIDGGDVYAAEAVAEESAFACDVVSLERLPDHVQTRIRSTGTVLFER